MKKWWFNSMLFKGKLKHKCELTKSMPFLQMDIIPGAWHPGGSEEKDTEKNISRWSDSNRYSFNDIDIRNIWSLISDNTFLVRDSNGDSYSVYFDIENHIFEIDNNSFFLSEFETFFSSYLNSRSKSNNHDYYHYMYDTKSSWSNHINSCIDSYLRFEVSIHSYILGDTENYSDSYISSFICSEGVSNSENGNSSIRIDGNSRDFNIRGRSNDFDINKKYKNLWVQCENCYGLNYKKFFRSKMNICEQCGYHLKMSSSDRIELLIDPGTWDPMDEDMVSMDPIEFHSEEEPYKDRIDSYQRRTGLTEAVQTGIGQLNGIPIAIGVMDFQFLGGSMGSVVGEKITRLIEYATNRSLPVIIVCASGGARMQEGSLSLMQMAKISSASYNYQSNKKLFYVSILTSPTTGGVTASFGMLGDVIIAEPNAYIAFAGKRVIEQTLNKTVPDGSQAAEYSFHKGLFDPIIPRNLLKGVLSELFQLHGFFPLKNIYI
uniref:Acetyl-coenzyme A carboxylase carboxyl transferase subunit beta, chloroplastic n=2 Tax=Allium TaxID=4678 RepID=A0A5B9T4Q9_ALLTU|nr:acetyl-CoA carboxylase carboxyltransferase beta subunit [Allium tuberosum]YP_010630544.1 acetyl-CoA carboxylase subunit beta [Allium taquetii]QAX27743.1 acetyl-CoA carboxylase beta subunit [Allium ramosum]QEG98774.1 acetyl-CoA carboxylase carboxyltransferase beta subunit [Allium tuberosum]QHQ73388.1 AccD [Allium tuberosum]WBN97590.1 acetyl-CoA carboxylase subunit beta [Allium taquetii]WHE18398.1 acetyl-CoA carboxylase subunit beta [Allium tuberosum]